MPRAAAQLQSLVVSNCSHHGSLWYSHWPEGQARGDEDPLNWHADGCLPV